MIGSQAELLAVLRHGHGFGDASLEDSRPRGLLLSGPLRSGRKGGEDELTRGREAGKSK